MDKSFCFLSGIFFIDGGKINFLFIITCLLVLILHYPTRLLPYPMVIIWKSIRYIEKIFIRYRHKKFAGAILVVIITIGVFMISSLIINLSYRLSPFLGALTTIFISCISFRIGLLRSCSIAIFKELKAGNIDPAYKKASEFLHKAEIKKSQISQAIVRGISENIVDGAISPLFYLILGGAPLAITYKTIDTLDSMIGFRDERYADFGWAAAKLDDIANFIPARITGLLIPLAALILGKDFKNSFKIMLRDRKKHPSPNSGIPEAAVAGALGIQLGGENYRLGDRKNNPSPYHIKDVIFLMYITLLIAVAAGILIISSVV